MKYSSLTDVVIPVYGKSNPRVYSVRRVTVHHMAGNLTVEGCASVFNTPGRQASSNYGIGSDGRIACYVSEDERAWTSASWENDQLAITIEVADYDTSAWSPSDAAYESTVRLCADICTRYGITPTYTGGTDGTFTEHCMFASTSCPGPWWHARMAKFVQDVREEMEGDMPLTDNDVKRIAQATWEYIYMYGTENQDRTLEKAYGTKQMSNGYNVLRSGFSESLEARKKIEEIGAKVDELSAKVDAISVAGVDVRAVAKAVNDDAAARMKE